MYTFFERLIDPLRNVSVERPPNNPYQFIWHFISPMKGVVFFTLLVTGVSTVCELYLFAYLGRIIDWMGDTERSDFLAVHGTTLLWMLFVAGILRPASMLASRSMIALALVPGITDSTRWQNHRYVLRQSMHFFQNDFAGRVAQKVMQTGNAVREVIINIVEGVWVLIIYLFGITVLLLDINQMLMIPIILWIIAYAAVVYFKVPPVRYKSADLSEARSALTGRVVDSYTNIQSVKLFAHHELEENFARAAIARHISSFRTLMRAIIGMTVTLTVLNTILILFVAGLSVYLWLHEAITVGEIAIANGLIIRLNQMSGWILRTLTSLFENMGTVENGVDTISQATQVLDVPNAQALNVSEGRVQFNNVSFRYDKAGDKSELPIIDGCTIDIAAGEKVGLVGRSGAGKSTLINLLMRFHDLNEGTISIDGQDISQVKQTTLRSNIAVVTQDTSLLHRSIRDNIRYGKADASDGQIVEAAKRAEAFEFMQSLSDIKGRVGLDALVGERGVKLSGGQRQRIAIARVILKDAPILILDEATSALDSEVEAAIQDQLNNLMAGKTVLAVAHRLSTIAELDRLIVLDQGKVVEVGSHKELLAHNGIYARLWHRQSGGFLGG